LLHQLPGIFLSGGCKNILTALQYRGGFFAAAFSGALIITLLTVSFQSIKAALMNPVKSLRSE